MDVGGLLVWASFGVLSRHCVAEPWNDHPRPYAALKYLSPEGDLGRCPCIASAAKLGCGRASALRRCTADARGVAVRDAKSGTARRTLMRIGDG
jgi:hypothetical protein